MRGSVRFRREFDRAAVCGAQRRGDQIRQAAVEKRPDRGCRGPSGRRDRLPQFRDTSPENCLEELERCVTELGFVGCLINPDPVEGDGAPPPGMGDEFWYPLYEKLVELDVPALVHSASSLLSQRRQIARMPRPR